MTGKLNLGVFRELKEVACLCPKLPANGSLKHRYIQPLEHPAVSVLRAPTAWGHVRPNLLSALSTPSQLFAGGRHSFGVIPMLRPLGCHWTLKRAWKASLRSKWQSCHLGGGITSESFTRLFSFLWDNDSSRIWRPTVCQNCEKCINLQSWPLVHKQA